MQLCKEGFTAAWDFNNRWETVDSDFSVLQNLEARSSSLLSSKGNRFKNTIVFSKKKSKPVMKLSPLQLFLLQCLNPKENLQLWSLPDSATIYSFQKLQ